jgi:hypothetical protein
MNKTDNPTQLKPETRRLLITAMTRRKTHSRKSPKSRKHTNTGNIINTSKTKNIIKPKTYISRLISEYYNNDEVSDRYLQKANKITHIFPPQRRIIVIGDIHGDFEVAIKCLILAGCIKYIEPPIHKSVPVMDSFFNTLEWIGGDTYIVQLGDQIDRVRPQRWDANDIARDAAYEDEGSTLEIFYLFYHLNMLAQKHGGRVLSIIGNHEIMNVNGDFRYVSKAEFKCFKEHLQHIYHRNSKYPYNSKTIKRSKLGIYSTNHSLPVGYRERLYAFAPTGLCANLIGSNYYTMLQIGNWLFCHGSPTVHISRKYSIDMVNNITSLYLLGVDSNDKMLDKHFNEIMHPTAATAITTADDNADTNADENSILWSRTFGEQPESLEMEKHLSRMLTNILHLHNNKNMPATKATHIAIGHTPQFNQGINTICNGRVYRCDIGMSRAFKSVKNNLNDSGRPGNIQVLEILNGKPNILRE